LYPVIALQTRWILLRQRRNPWWFSRIMVNYLLCWTLRPIP